MTLEQLWMEAHIALASDGYVTVMGNDRCPASVRDTMVMFPGYYFLVPTRQEMEEYLRETNREDWIEYLMEDY